MKESLPFSKNAIQTSPGAESVSEPLQIADPDSPQDRSGDKCTEVCSEVPGKSDLFRPGESGGVGPEWVEGEPPSTDEGAAMLGLHDRRSTPSGELQVIAHSEWSDFRHHDDLGPDASTLGTHKGERLGFGHPGDVLFELLEFIPHGAWLKRNVETHGHLHLPDARAFSVADT